MTWYEALAKFLIENGFQRSRDDYCVFVRKEADGTFSYILLWVDDIIVAGASNEVIDAIKSMLKENFKMDDRGTLHWFLGMQILRSEDKITADQEKYIESVLSQFNMSDCKPMAKIISKFSRIASIPHILHVVNQVSRFFEKPNTSHWKAAKHVLKYLKGTTNLRLTFLKNSNTKLTGDADADWSGDLDHRKFTTGYYFKFQGTGGAISWEVKKQATVALSSTEAEYQAMAAAVQEVIYLRALMKEFGYPMKEPTDRYRRR